MLKLMLPPRPTLQPTNPHLHLRPVRATLLTLTGIMKGVWMMPRLGALPLNWDSVPELILLELGTATAQ